MKKEIRILGKTFLYEVISHDCGDYGASTCHDTHFFDPNFKIKKVKKYLLFGPVIEKKVYTKIFKVYFNIESEDYLKAAVRNKLEREVKLLDRANEIKRGEII